MARIVDSVSGVSWLLGAFLVGCSAGSAGDDGAVTTAAATTAAPIALSGKLRFAGHVQPVARLTTDVIDTRMADADARLAKLQADGATCEFVGADTWRCTLMHPAADVPLSSLDAIAAGSRDLYASFGASLGKPSIVSQGDSLTEWQIPQKGSSSAGPFDSYRYLELDGGLVKIILPGKTENESLELLVQGGGQHLARWKSTVVTRLEPEAPEAAPAAPSPTTPARLRS